MGGVPIFRRRAALAGSYAAAIVALTALLIAVEARTAQLVGLHRAVYPDVGFAGTPLVDDVSRSVDLDFLADDPELPRRFFSVRWQGFWHLPEAGEVELHGAGDDRLDVWLDGGLVIRRRPPADMHTETRVLRLDAGLHDLRVEYEQHGGGYAARLLWAPREGRPRPLPLHRIFHSRPGSEDLRLVRRAAWLRVVVALGWGAPALFGIVFLVRRATRRTRNAPAGERLPRSAKSVTRSLRCVVPAGVAVQGARALVFAGFVLLATPSFLYAAVPPLRGVQTALWWSAGLILLLCPLLGTRVFDYTGHAQPGGDDDAGEARPGARLAPLLLFGGLALLVVAYWHRVHLDDLRSLPIDSRYADMLPLMLSGFADLDQGLSPYRPHQVPWTLTGYFLPLTFLPYYLAYKCGFDVRHVNLASFALIGLVPLLLWPRTGSTARQILFFGCWVLTVSAFHAVIDSHRFTRIIHLGPYWLYVAVTYVMLLLGRPYAAAGGALCALAARETAVFHVAPLCVALLRFRPATARIFLTVIALGLAGVFLPFYLDDPSFYAGNLAQYSSLGWVVEESGGYHFVGLTGLLHRIGMLEYHWHFLVAGVAICLGLYLALATTWDTGRTLLLCFCCTNVSATFALVPWPYLTLPSLLLLTVLVLGGVGRAAGPTTARG